MLAARPSRSRPQVGVVTVRTVGFTAEGRIMITFERTLLVYRRGHGPRFADVEPQWDRRSLAAAGLPAEGDEPRCPCGADLPVWNR